MLLVFGDFKNPVGSLHPTSVDILQGGANIYLIQYIQYLDVQINE